jgi:hypothetical protein
VLLCVDIEIQNTQSYKLCSWSDAGNNAKKSSRLFWCFEFFYVPFFIKRNAKNRPL